MSFLKYIAITSVTIALLSVMTYSGVFGEECVSYEDGSSNCKNFEVKKWDCKTDGNKICGNSNDNNNKKSDNDNDNDNHKSKSNHNDNDNKKSNPRITEYLELRTDPDNSGIYEDQLTVCNAFDVCAIINIDDYLSTQKANQLQTVFSHDINTFTVSDLN